MLCVYRYRVKNPTKYLDSQSRSVNFVWNYCNETQRTAVSRGNRWLTGFDLNKLTVGCSKDLALHSGTINAVCEQYAQSRQQHKKPWLRWRSKKSLGWIPLKGRDLSVEGKDFYFHGTQFRVWNSRPIPVEAKIKDGCSFAQDARGRWYLNVALELPNVSARETAEGVGIDLGLKTLATLSDGSKIENPQSFRQLEAKLGTAQRAHKRSRHAAIHAKIKNVRADWLHKESTKIVKQFDYIAVGNVNASGLAKTKMAKSIYDAGWSDFRRMLAYKAIAHGASYEEVNESFTTQVCSSCGCVTGPKGVADLGIRQWVCGDCGAVHDRDVNSAINILARSGHRAPAEGIPVL
jgi:putative transposase